MMDFIPSRIASARHLEGWTQRELAQKTGMPQSRLSKIQNGFSPFEKAEAQAVANALGYPVSYFASDDPIVPMTSLTYRKNSKSSMAELSAVAAEYSALISAVERLADRLGMRAKSREWMDALSPHSQTISAEDIERISSETREHLNLGIIGPVKNLTRSMERQGIVVAPMRSTGGGDNDDAKLTSEGVSYPSDRGIPCVGYSAGLRISGDRQRFTKAHELGHLILHRLRRPSTSQQMEREAHLFASALLLPADDIRPIIHGNATLRDFLPVKSGWGVSIAASISRAHTLGIIDADRYRSLNIQLSSRGWKKKEPVEVGIEHPLLLRQMIEAAFGSHAVPSNGSNTRAVKSLEAADSLGVPFRYLDYWSGGLVEEGVDLGFVEQRISDAASDRMASA